MSCNCPTEQTFPQEQKQFSLTNRIEIAKIDQICNTNRNKFDMLRFNLNKTIKQSVITLGIKQSEYDVYLVYEIQNGRFDLHQKSFSDYIERKSIYFFVNKAISKPLKYLNTKLYDLWRTKSGNIGTSTTPFPIPTIRFPLIMPSREL